MTKFDTIRRAALGTAIAAAGVAGSLGTPFAAPALAQGMAVQPANDGTLLVRGGRMGRPDGNMTAIRRAHG